MSFYLKTILEASTNEINKQRAVRLTEAGIAASKERLEKIHKEKRNKEEKIQDLMTFSASTDLNSGVQALTNEQMASKIDTLHTLSVELELIDAKLKVAERIHNELAGETK